MYHLPVIYVIYFKWASKINLDVHDDEFIPQNGAQSVAEANQVENVAMLKYDISH